MPKLIPRHSSSRLRKSRASYDTVKPGVKVTSPKGTVLKVLGREPDGTLITTIERVGGSDGLMGLEGTTYYISRAGFRDYGFGS